MVNVRRSIYKALTYFQIFRYPLTKDELIRFMDTEVKQDIQSSLDELCSQGCIYRHGDYFATVSDATQVERRELGNKVAKAKMKRAIWMAKLISKFPFVRAVMVSGSLSKGYMEQDSDVDYFIMTKPGRLWVARTLLILFKKVCLLNSRKYFCVNYFIDEENLVIEEQNLFTATEMVTLIPLFGRKQYDDLVVANSWAWKYYPNHPAQETNYMFIHRFSPLKRLGEWLLAGNWGGKLDAFCMRKTVGHWKSKFPDMKTETFDLTLKSRPYVSKHHPQNFQKRVLDRMQEGMSEFDAQYAVPRFGSQKF